MKSIRFFNLLHPTSLFDNVPTFRAGNTYPEEDSPSRASRSI